MKTTGPSKHDLEWAGRLRSVIGPLHRRLRRQRIEPFTPTELSVIGAISRHGPITLGALAERERLSAPSISMVIASLEERGVVDRIVDESDRRVSLVSLSAAGDRELEAGRTRMNWWLAGRISHLSAADRAALAAAMPALEQLAAPDD